jgi:hypothetical protein
VIVPGYGNERWLLSTRSGCAPSRVGCPVRDLACVPPGLSDIADDLIQSVPWGRAISGRPDFGLAVARAWTKITSHVRPLVIPIMGKMCRGAQTGRILRSIVNSVSTVAR